jgi:hypothetical protein
LQTYSSDCGGQFSDSEKRELQKFFDAEGGSGEKWGMSAEELESLRKLVMV